MTNYANEYPGVCDIDRAESPVTHQNVQEAFDQLMFIKLVSLLLANQDESGKEIEINRLKDLGQLFFFLSDQPASVLGELESQYSDRQSDFLRSVPSDEGGAS